MVFDLYEQAFFKRRVKFNNRDTVQTLSPYASTMSASLLKTVEFGRAKQLGSLLGFNHVSVRADFLEIVADLV